MTALMEKYRFLEQLRDVATPVAIADPQAPDCPLIFANTQFEALTGYAEAEVLGKNCRFLQTGPLNEAARGEMRASVAAQRSATVCLVNARKDGVQFLNYLCMDPLVMPEGETLMIGCQFRFGPAMREGDFLAHLDRLDRALDFPGHDVSTTMVLDAMELRRASVKMMVDNFLRGLRLERRLRNDAR